MRIDCKKLSEARKRRGFALTEAAEEIGIPPSVLRRWETGKGVSPFESGRETYPVMALLELYEIEIEELYYDRDIDRLKKTFDIIEMF